MTRLFGALPACLMLASFPLGSWGQEEGTSPLHENFQTGLSPEWFWGLGTWTARDGILRGYESGPRRHGPVKMRRYPFQDAVIDCEFRLEGKAKFAGIIFNGSQQRGHLAHLVMSQDTVRLLVHPEKGKTVELLKQPAQLQAGGWHRVHLEFSGDTFTASIDGQSLQARHSVMAEKKQTFGLGGDSGGPEGEKAGALEFRHLKVTKNER